MELQVGGKGEKNDRESTMLKYIAFLQVDDKMIHAESYRIIWGRRKRIRENNRRLN
jgi:hypothetical protein